MKAMDSSGDPRMLGWLWMHHREERGLMLFSAPDDQESMERWQFAMEQIGVDHERILVENFGTHWHRFARACKGKENN